MKTSEINCLTTILPVAYPWISISYWSNFKNTSTVMAGSLVGPEQGYCLHMSSLLTIEARVYLVLDMKRP